jgi:hypothetical protein
MGLEPLVRRHRPQALVAWSRLIAGNARNRAVGGSLLIGALAGALWMMLGELDRIWVESMGLDLSWGWLGAGQLNASVSLGTVFGTALRELEGAVIGGLLAAVLFALTARLRAPRALGAAAFVTVAAAIHGIDSGAHLPVSVLTLGLAVGVLWLVVLHRFGLLSLVVAVLCYGLLTAYPITLDRGVWFAQAGYFAIAMVLMIGVLGVVLAREPGVTRDM